MNRALLEILLRSLRGRFLRWARQLRQPRYLVAFLAGLGYFGLVLGPRLLSGGVGRVRIGPGSAAAPIAAWTGPLALGLGLAGAVVLTLLWILASAKPALPLSEAEIGLLLPAPLTRRQVLSFALLRAQVGLLFGSFFIALFTSGGHPGQRLLRWAASWGILTLFDLHNRGVQLWKARNLEIPVGQARWRRGVALAAFLAFWTAVVVGIAVAWRASGGFPPGSDISDLGRVLERFFAAAGHGLLGAALWPFASLTGLWIQGFTLATGAFLAVLLVGHWEWVVRSAGHFEDATIERAQRQRQRGQRQSRYELASAKNRERQPFDLLASSRPEAVILWKNLLAVSRAPLRRRLVWTLGFAAVLLPAAVLFPLPSPLYAGLLIAPLLMIGVNAFLSGLWMRNDLRGDLQQLEILRPWPIAGTRLVAAELLAPALMALQIEAFGLLALAAVLTGSALHGTETAILTTLGLGTFGGIAAALAATVLLAVPITLTSIAFHNVAALALPSWIPLGPQRRRGTALTGQQMLLFLGHLLAMTLAALPGALLAGGIFFAQKALGGSFQVWELPLLALAASLSFWLATGLLIKAGGALWERLDASQELLGGGE